MFSLHYTVLLILQQNQLFISNRRFEHIVMESLHDYSHLAFAGVTDGTLEMCLNGGKGS